MQKTKEVIYTDIKPAVEAVKQAGRIVLVSVIPLLVVQLQNSKIDWRAIGVTGAIALLMAVDKYLHLEGKLQDNDQLTKGLTQF
jgi:hypothetical protein